MAKKKSLKRRVKELEFELTQLVARIRFTEHWVVKVDPLLEELRADQYCEESAAA